MKNEETRQNKNEEIINTIQWKVQKPRTQWHIRNQKYNEMIYVNAEQNEIKESKTKWKMKKSLKNEIKNIMKKISEPNEKWRNQKHNEMPHENSNHGNDK